LGLYRKPIVKEDSHKKEKWGKSQKRRGEKDARKENGSSSNESTEPSVNEWQRGNRERSTNEGKLSGRPQFGKRYTQNLFRVNKNSVKG